MVLIGPWYPLPTRRTAIGPGTGTIELSPTFGIFAFNPAVGIYVLSTLGTEQAMVPDPPSTVPSASATMSAATASLLASWAAYWQVANCNNLPDHRYHLIGRPELYNHLLHNLPPTTGGAGS